MRRLVTGLAAAALANGLLAASPAATAPAGAGTAPVGPETAPTVAASDVGEITSLGTPLQDVLLIGGTAAPGPSGSEVLWSVSSGAPAHLNAVDPATGEAIARLDLPGSSGSWAVDAGADGSLYVGTYGSPHLFRWTAAGGVEDLGNPVAGETFVWDVTVAADGKVYGGTSPGGRLFGYDPATDAFRDYGKLSPTHSYIRSVATHGQTLFAGTENPGALVQVDLASGATTPMPLPDGLDNATAWAYDVDVVGDHLYVRFGTAFPSPLYVWDIAAGEWVDVIESAHGLEVSPADDEGRVYVISAGEMIRYDPTDGSRSPTGVPFVGRVANTRGIGWVELGLPDYPGQSLVGLLWRGLAFRYSPATGAFSFVQTGIQGEPIDVTALSEGPDGRVYAGGFLNGGFAAVDADTGEREEFHTFSQSEAMTTHDGRLYIGAYPDARIYGYDPALPWHSPEYSPAPEPGLADNPRRLVDFKADRQIRPRALVSAGDHLAVGTMPDLGELGGVFALYDAGTGAVVHSQRNLILDQSIVDLAYRDGVVYGSTSIYGGQSATPPTQREAKVFAWSVAERRLLWELVPAPGKATIPALSFDDDGRLWGLSGTELFAIDVDAAEVIEHVTYGGGSSSSGDLAFNPVDGYLYADLAGAELARVDVDTLERTTLRTGAVSHVVAHSSGDVFFSAGSELFRYALPRCISTLTGAHQGALVVDEGTVCLDGAEVSGTVTVGDGAGIVVTDSTVAGAIRADRPREVDITGSTLRASVAIDGATGAVRIADSTISGSVSLTGGTGVAAVVSGSTIRGSLQCSGNAEVPTDAGTPNDIVGARGGQCADL